MINNNIKNILSERNISIRKLSRDLEMSYSNAYNLVNRKNLYDTKLGTLIEIAQYLNVDINKLYKD